MLQYIIQPLAHTTKAEKAYVQILSGHVLVLCYWVIKLFSVLDSWLAKTTFRSSIKSSTCSIPTETRINESFTPEAFRVSAGMDLCVIWAGWHIRLFTP